MLGKGFPSIAGEAQTDPALLGKLQPSMARLYKGPLVGAASAAKLATMKLQKGP